MSNKPNGTNHSTAAQADGSLSSIIYIPDNYIFFQFRKQSDRVVPVTLVAGYSVAMMFFFSLICFTFILFSSLHSSIVLQRATAAAKIPIHAADPASVTLVAQHKVTGGTTMPLYSRHEGFLFIYLLLLLLFMYFFFYTCPRTIAYMLSPILL